MNEKQMRVETCRAELLAQKARTRDIENRKKLLPARLAAERSKFEADALKEYSALECELAVAIADCARDEAYLEKFETDLTAGYEQ